MRRNRFSRQWLVNQHDEQTVNSQIGNCTTNANACMLQQHQHTDAHADTNSLLTFHLIQTHPHNECSSRLNDGNDDDTSRSGRHCRVAYKSCFNQILEVLLALVLVNCLVFRLTQLPLALAAYGNLQQDRGGYYHSGASAFSSSFLHSGNSPLSSNEEDVEEDDPFFRQPHSIGGSAFGYNGLQIQHNLDDNLLRSQNFKISPKPCTTGRIEGTCMFVWECIKSEGRHVGMCVDSFMFGSCCVHNYTDNIVQHETFSYTRPTKPLGMGSMNHRPRPPQHPHRPSIR